MCGTYGNSPRLIPESKMKAYKRPPESLPRIKTTHEADWVRACKEGEQPGANFDYSGPLTETVLLGNIAKRVNKRLEWTAEEMKITNLPEANKYVRARYREHWKL